MSDAATINIRIDGDVKRAMEQVCRELGLTLTAAFTVYARKVARERRIPFELDLDPFFSESNQAHLRAVRADSEAGRNMAVHELIDA